MEVLREYLPFLLPVILIELVLMIIALRHVLRHPHYRFGSKALWIILVVGIQIIGPVVYFVFGRGQEA
jgi:hypothetical protein